MKKLSIITAILFLTFAYSCKKDSMTEPSPSNEQTTAARGNEIPNTPAYFDGELYTINLMELSDQAAASVIAHNSSLNEIYSYEDLDEAQTPFLPIIDAVPGSDMNPMWLEVEIEFNAGFTPRQFKSEEELDAAVDAGEVTLTETDEVYRCSVINH